MCAWDIPWLIKGLYTLFRITRIKLLLLLFCFDIGFVIFRGLWIIFFTTSWDYLEDRVSSKLRRVPQCFSSMCARRLDTGPHVEQRCPKILGKNCMPQLHRRSEDCEERSCIQQLTEACEYLKYFRAVIYELI